MVITLAPDQKIQVKIITRYKIFLQENRIMKKLNSRNKKFLKALLYNIY